MVYEATRSFATRPTSVQTPRCPRAASGLDAMSSMYRAPRRPRHARFHFAADSQRRVGFIGLKREERLARAVLPQSLPKNLSRFEVILIDPNAGNRRQRRLAALDLLAEQGAKQVRLVNLVAAPEGIRRVRKRYPQPADFHRRIDRRLNNKGYILPAWATWATGCLGVNRLTSIWLNE